MAGRGAARFETVRITIPAGGEMACSASEWHDQLVVVEQGSLELETRMGMRRTFAAGAVLTLRRMRLTVLRNRGSGTTVLAATSRRPDL